MQRTFRWGIVGTGRIIHRWVPALQHLPDTELAAVCSTSLEKAGGIARQYSPSASCHDDIRAFAASGIDAAYVATSHPHHLALAKACLEEGIPVLCEKPITPNAAQCRELVNTARRTGVFLMEGFWTRFFPAVCQALDWIAAGEIGDIVRMEGSFTAGPLDYRPEDRLFRLQDAGGALLDIGVYPLQCAAFFAGAMPEQLSSFCTLGESGVDYSADLLLRFPTGATASLFCSFLAQADHTFTILGTQGRIELPHSFWKPRRAVLINGSGETVYQDPDNSGIEGFFYEIAHVQDCLAKGLVESPLLPLNHSLQIIKLCDGLRQQWGLRYPFE